MVAPVGFQTNVETAMDNFFMKRVDATPFEIEKKVGGAIRDSLHIF